MSSTYDSICPSFIGRPFNACVVIRSAGREAGSSTAAAFPCSFVGDTPWVHLDIAGTGWSSKVASYQPRGATGIGVRLLLEVLHDWRGARLD